MQEEYIVIVPVHQAKEADDEINPNSENIGQLHIIGRVVLSFRDCRVGVKTIVEHCFFKITLK